MLDTNPNNLLILCGPDGRLTLMLRTSGARMKISLDFMSQLAGQGVEVIFI